MLLILKCFNVRHDVQEIYYFFCCCWRDLQRLRTKIKIF